MARNTTERTASDEKHQFEHFQETVKTLLQVPKKEVDKAVYFHQEERKRKQDDEPN